MSITNVKSTFLAKLLGQTNERKNLPEEGMFTPDPAAGVNPKLRFQNQSPLFGEGGIGAPAAQQAPANVPASSRSRYNLYEMTQPKPTRDTESEDIIKKRAKVNALGAGISGLAGLASMATGGDVPDPVDLVTPWNMDQTKMLDSNYRTQLQDWTDRGFQVDQANTQLKNNEIDQTIDAENMTEQIKLRSEEARKTAMQRAQDDLNKIAAQGDQKLMEAMQGVGVDPYSKTAYQDFLNKKAKKYSTDLQYDQSRIGYNQRYGKGGATDTPGKDQQYPLSTLKKGRDVKISRLESQKAADLKKATMPNEKQQIEKYYNDLIADERKYKPGVNPLIDAETAELGYQIEDQEMAGENGGNQEDFDYGYPEDFNQGGSKGAGSSAPTNQNLSQPVFKAPKVDMSLPAEQRQSILTEMGQKVTNNLQSLSGDNPDLELASQLADEWVNAGLYDNKEDAWNTIFLIAKEAAENQ